MTRQPMQNAPTHRKPDQNLLALLRAVIYCVFAAILLLGLLLLILPTFRIKEVRVSGNSYYTAEQIIESSGIREGSEMLSLNVKEARQGIWDACDYVDRITIKRRSLWVVEIIVEEKVNMVYTAFNDSYIAFDPAFKVLSQSADPADYADLLYVELPPIAAMSVGGQIRFVNEDIDMSYVKTLLDAFCSHGILSRITSVDLSKKYGASYVLDGNCHVELGRVDSLDLKFKLVDEILTNRQSPDPYAYIDVSSTQKPTYRASMTADFD